MRLEGYITGLCIAVIFYGGAYLINGWRAVGAVAGSLVLAVVVIAWRDGK